MLLEDIQGRLVHSRRVEDVHRRFLVQAEQAQEGDVPAAEIALERSPRAQLAQRDGQLHRARIHVGRGGDPVYLVHLQVPRRPAGTVIGPRCLEQSEAGASPFVVDPFGVVRTDGVAGGRDVGHGEHLVPPQRLAEGQPEHARVDGVVDTGL